MMEDVNYCCLFCYRTFAKEVKVTPGENAHETQVQFLLLLKRYLIHGHDADSGKWIKVLSDCITSNKSLQNVISPCDVCSGVIKSFCEYYDELKVLEMKLKWKLETLTNIVKGSEKVKLRRRLFRAKLKESMDHHHDGKSIISDIMKQLKSFRTDFVMKCAVRFKDCYPKVKLKRCDCLGSNTRTTLKRRHDQDVFDDHQDNKVPRLNELEMGSSNKVALRTELLNDPEGEPVPPKSKDGESNVCTGINEASMTCSSVATRDGDGDLESGIEGESAATDNQCENRTISSQAMNPDLSEVNDSSAALGGDADSTNVSKLKSADQTRQLHKPISIAVATYFDVSLKLNKDRETSLNTNTIPVDADVFQTSESDMNPGPEKEVYPISFNTVMNKASSEPSDSMTVAESEIQRSFLSSSANALDKTWHESKLPVDTSLEQSSAEGVEKSSSSSSNESYKFVQGIDANSAQPQKTTNSEEQEVAPRRRISLRQRYKCTTCSQKFSASEKLEEHAETCVNARDSSAEGKGQGNHYSCNDNDVGFILNEQDDSETAQDQFPMDPKCLPNYEHEDYDFMTAIFKCDEEKCDSTFYNQADLDNHSKLHGDFQCSSCEITMSCAPELAFHELQHRKTKFQNISCPRQNCTFVTNNDQNFCRHFINCLLKLTPNIHTCPVCREQVPADTAKSLYETDKRRIMHHFRANHDLNLNDEDKVSEAVFCCNVPRCSAFFRTELQRSHHNGIIHNKTKRKDRKSIPEAHNVSILEIESQEVSQNHEARSRPETVVNSDRQISLRQRYPCTTCSKKFSSSGKLKEHMENCIDRESVSDDESETSQCSDNDNDFGNDEDMDIDNEDDDDDKWDEEEDSKPLPIESKEEGRDKIRRRKVPKGVGNSHCAREEDRFICEVEGCKKNCASERKLIEHMALKHSKKTTNKCCFCSQKFPSRIHLIFHQNQIHQKIQPDWESKDTKQLPVVPKTELRQKKVFACPMDDCREKFYTQQNLDSHSLLHGNFKCLFCEETRTYSPDLALHEASSHKLENVMIKRKVQPHKNSFFCARCDYATRSETHYVQHHLESHLNLKMVVEKVCCICKVVFKGGINFRQTIFFHYVTHHELNDESCNDTVHRCDHSNCEGVYFLKRKQLSSHKALIHQEILTKFPCNLCSKEFPDSHNRDRHRMTRHKNELNLPIACSQEGCWMRFDNEHSLKLHLSRKHSQKILLCTQCGKSFQGLAALSSHIHRAHKSESQKPKEKSTFVCPQCGKIFGQKEQMNLHVLGVHIGPEGWKHICSTCGKKCLTSGKLEEHKRTHTKEKPFTCEHCGLSYAHRHNFRHHLKDKHGIVLEPPKRSKKIKE